MPFSLKFIDDRYYLQAIEKHSEVVLSINDTDFRELLREVFRYVYHVGNYVYSNKLNQILPFFLKKTGNEMITTSGSYRFGLTEKRPELVSCLCF